MKHPDGWYHHSTRVGPHGEGFIDHWHGEAFVDGQFLPEFMQLQLHTGMDLHVRTREAGKIVAFVMMPDGGFYVLPFVEVKP